MGNFLIKIQWFRKACLLLSALCLIAITSPLRATDLALDTEDPMFFERTADFVSRTGFDYFDSEIALVSERFSYGINSKLAIDADIRYQQDFSGRKDGFSNFGLGLTYRMYNEKILSDLFGGIKFAGSAYVPDFANDIYYTGARVGRQWGGMTLAAALQTSWIFDETRGMAWIDLTPEVYFRFAGTWSVGPNLMFRKATDPNFNQQRANLKLAKRYGHTMYVGQFGYEFENKDWQIGFRMNILF